MIPLMLVAAASAFGPCTDTLCNPGVLGSYFEKLAEQKDGANRHGRGVHILQIGDSHTAGDTITGAWRDILQARYGGGGRGVLPPGRPYDGFLTRGVTATMSSGWKVSGTFGAVSAEPRAPLGLSGFSITSTMEGARISLTADPEQRFNRFVVCAIARPDAGTLAIRIGLKTVTMRLDSPTTRPECRTVESDQTETVADVMAEGGPVTITSWASFRDEGGVVVSNVGVVGSQLVHFARTTDTVLAEELRTYEPDLIVIAFGTNEGFAPRFSPFEYEVTLRSQIGRIRRLAGGNIPILLLGAPDASTRRPELLNNAPGPTPAPCYAPPRLASPAPAASSSFGSMIAGVLAGEGVTIDTAAPQPVAAPAVNDARPLFPPAGLSAVREVQRRVAQSLHVAFWDWEARMGGRCAAVKWTRANPPLMRGDYVHFNSAGGREIGSRLQADLDQAAASRGE